MTEQSLPTLTDKQLADLNQRLSQRLAARRSSFFFPELNGPDDPYGLEAFHVGDLGPTNQFVETALVQKTAKDSSIKPASSPS